MEKWCTVDNAVNKGGFMSTIIWYGAGKNLREHEREFLEETGMPECIVDKNDALYGTEYTFKNGNSCSIISLDSAKKRYPEADYYLTLAEHNVPVVYEFLKNEEISEIKIHCFGGEIYCRGCFNLNYYSYISSVDVRACAHPPYMKSFFYKNQIVSEQDVRETVEEHEKWRIETIEKLRRGEKTSCEGCSALHYGFFTKDPQIKVLGVGPNFKGGTKCNCNCFYCNQNEVIHEESNQNLYNYDIHRIAGELYPTLENIILADGEPSLLPHLDDLCDLAEEKKWSINFNTSGIKFSQKLADTMAKNPKSNLCVALDSGTSETYEKIKRVKTFDRVIDNLHKYHDAGVRIFLKYILIPTVNDNLNDINKFIDIAKDICCEHITLSQNMSGFVDGVKHAEDPDMPESMFMYFTYMVARFEEEGFDWDFQIEFVSARDINRIEQLRKK